VRATRAGHEAAEARVTLARGESQPLHLTLAAQHGEVQVIADPANAEVLVDGQPRGTAGRVLELSAAAHEIEVRHAGYEPHRQTVTPRPGFPQTVRARLRSLEEAKAAARPAAVRRTPAGHELRLVEGGRFQMGASRREPGRRGNETPREVELARPFYLAAREVTNAQFRKFKPDHSSGRFGAHGLTDDSQPVVQVTWEAAAEYCNWLSAQEGLPPAYATSDGRLASTRPLGTGYRLPTEAEWSRAARYAGGGPLKYPWGPSLPAPPKAGNYADESARPLVPVVLQGYDDRYPVSAPVGTFPPNALGFFDLGGNVAEWVHDVYAIPPPDAPVERDPVGPPPGDLHVILGSSYLHGSISELRLAYRDYGLKPRPDVGFRVARYAE
jgi:formylglycine-generating enzyme required for sulfatase activity